VKSLNISEFVRAGDLVVVPQGAGEPLTLTEDLVASRHAIGAFRILLGAVRSETFRLEHADIIEFLALGGGGGATRLITHGKCGVLPVHMSDVPALFDTDVLRPDVVVLQLSAKSVDGRHSLGVAGDYIWAAIRRARTVVAEVNSEMPFVFGLDGVELSDLDGYIETSRPLVELLPTELTQTADRIGSQVAGLVPDGACLQIGIGSVPNAVLANLSTHEDLGIHSGVVSDSLVSLMEGGTVNNRLKSIDKGVTVAGALLGTRRLYRFADLNESIQVREVEYTHDVLSFKNLSDFVSINSALEVDLTGQVNAEVLDGRYVGAVGGQVDFVRGARHSAGGRSIIALPASSSGASRIVSRLSSGSITTARSDVDTVVTEHGIAELRSLSVPDRVKAMLAVADPEVRDTLRAEWESYQCV
jgi:acyl-CoA hydrolase